MSVFNKYCQVPTKGSMKSLLQLFVLILLISGLSSCELYTGPPPELTPDKLCNYEEGMEIEDTAQWWGVVVKYPTGCLESTLNGTVIDRRYYANSYAEAQECGETQTGLEAIELVCEYVLKIEEGWDCRTATLLAGSSSDAISCVRYSGHASATITDVTDEVFSRHPGTCIGGIRDGSVMDRQCNE